MSFENEKEFPARRSGLNPKNRRWLTVPVLMILLLLAAKVFAHRVVLFAWIENGTVYTQSKFSAGHGISQGEITVFDEAGGEILRGRTDDQGLFSFPLASVSSPTGLKIVVNAGMGHQGEWNLSKQTVQEAMGGPLNASSAPSETGENEQSAFADETPAPSADKPENPACDLTRSELERIVEAAVDRKLSPVMDMLVSIRQEAAVGLDDIVAGLGYILGLTGLAAWLYARKKDK